MSARRFRHTNSCTSKRSTICARWDPFPACPIFSPTPNTWSLINVRDAEFWGAVGDTDPLEDWKCVDQPTLVVYGEEDANVPTQASVQRLEEFDKTNIEINVYTGSGHAVEDPPGQGDSIFRKDALDDIVEFIHAN